MDPRLNPYSPGAGTPPPELAGRDDVIEKASIALHRLRNGLSSKSLMLIGLRGVGKTVLLNRLNTNAEAEGFATVSLEAPERKSLPALLIPALRTALIKLDRIAATGDLAKKSLRALGGFVKVMKIKFDDIEFGLDLGAEKGVADSGDLDADLIDLLRSIGEAAKERSTAVVLFIDELQYVEEAQLASLISALHKCAQLQLPVTLVGAGLPQLAGQMGKAKSYAERLFEFVSIGPLSYSQAQVALTSPAQRVGVDFTNDALTEIMSHTHGYPYFIQEWGKHSWNCSKVTPISFGDVAECATAQALAELDQSFFRVRLDRLTPSEKRYMQAMATLGPGPHRSGDIAHALGKEVRTVAPVRAKLIEKGMIYSPSHGDTAFTVPLFDQYLMRIGKR